MSAIGKNHNNGIPPVVIAPQAENPPVIAQFLEVCQLLKPTPQELGPLAQAWVRLNPGQGAITADELQQRASQQHNPVPLNLKDGSILKNGLQLLLGLENSNLFMGLYPRLQQHFVWPDGECRDLELLQSQALSHMGDYLLKANRPQSAIQYLSLAVQLQRHLEETNMPTDLLLQNLMKLELGDCHYQLEDYRTAHSFFQEVIEKLEELARFSPPICRQWLFSALRAADCCLGSKKYDAALEGYKIVHKTYLEGLAAGDLEKDPITEIHIKSQMIKAHGGLGRNSAMNALRREVQALYDVNPHLRIPQSPQEVEGLSDSEKFFTYLTFFRRL
jgi:tetratricopeptide (TPR) repeat protein